MTNATDAKTEKILDRVQKLLAIADHPNTGEAERELAYAQASSLINKHAIDEAMLRMSQTTTQRRAPEKRTVAVASGSGMGVAASALRSILHEMARTYRCSIAVTGFGDKVDLYGASEDVAWVEMLFTSTYFQLATKINPKWDESKSYDENVYNFKVAGFKWSDINRRAVDHKAEDARKWEVWGNVQVDEQGFPIYGHMLSRFDEGAMRWLAGTDWAAGDRMRRAEYRGDKISGSMISAYRRWAKKIGDTNPVATQSHQVYRLSFIEGFKHQMFNRLYEARRDMEQQMDTIPGAALALADMTEEAKRMMFGDHPHLDPEEQRRQREADKQAYADKLAAMSDSERAKFLEAEERLARKLNKPRKVKYYDLDDSASRRGSKAADGVNMNRNAGSAGGSAPKGELN